MFALRAAQPTPMSVRNPATGQVWHVEDGVCGFAWINVKPARGAFVNFCKANAIGHRGQYGGWNVWVSEGGQSMQRKEAYARAFAEVLRDAGLKAFAQSRMD